MRPRWCGAWCYLEGARTQNCAALVAGGEALVAGGEALVAGGEALVAGGEALVAGGEAAAQSDPETQAWKTIAWYSSESRDGG
jgi:hypothetical protein